MNCTNYASMVLLVMTVLTLGSTSSLSAGEMKISTTLCEYISNPLGLDTLRPRFTWQLDSYKRGQLQTAYQILVATSQAKLDSNIGDAWDSGKVRSDETVNVPYGGKPLQSEAKRYWKVRSWDKNGKPGPFSQTANFQMALLEQSDWKGIWIAGEDSDVAPLLRKAFTLQNKPVQSARAYICGIGYYELHINGKKVGDSVLDPGWTEYDKRNPDRDNPNAVDWTSKRVLYATYDVTDMLKAGSANAMGVILGNGLHGKAEYGQPKLIVQLNIRYKDGSKENIVTDGTWKTIGSPIVSNNVYAGEAYDSREEKDGWDTAAYSDASWKPAIIAEKCTGKLCSQTSPPDKIVRSIAPVKVTKAADGGYVFDVGENITGWVRLRNLKGERGKEISVLFGEELGPDGTIPSAKTGYNTGRDVYVLNGSGIESFEPRFTFHGFRYFQVYYGSPYAPTLRDAEVKVVHTAVDTSVGSFQCSNDLINWIHDAFRRVQLNNMHSGIPSDCPTREKLGYTGDGQLACEATIHNFDMAQFYTKWMNDISDAQNRIATSPSFGFVPHTAPYRNCGGGPPWGSACIIVPWQNYVYYGDKTMLQQHYGTMKRWMQYMSTRTDGKNIIVREEPGGWTLGEWSWPVTIYNSPVNETNHVPDSVVNTYYYAMNARMMSEIASVLVLPKDADYYAKLSKTIEESFNSAFLENVAPNQYSTGTMGADIYPLALGIVPDAKKDKVFNHLVYNLTDPSRMNGHFDTGIIGTPLLLDVLAQNGRGNLAFSLLTQTTYPSIGYWRSLGATTLWENWEPELGTHGHPMFGSVDAFMFKYMAGINTDPKGPAYKKIVIKPSVLGDMSYVKSSVRSVRGLVKTNWAIADGAFVMDVVIPANSVAEIYIPMDKSGEIKSVMEAGTGKLHPVWNNTGYVAGTPGITGARTFSDATGSYIVVHAGSGSYQFKTN